MQELTTLKTLLKTFEADHPDIQVEVLHVPENYYQKLHILIASGLTPDVMLLNNLMFPVYHQHDVFADLGPRLAASKDLARSQFFDNALKAFEVNAKATSQPFLGALPRDVSVLAVYVNTSLLNNAGVSLPSRTWTWQEAIQLGQQLKASDWVRQSTEARYAWSFYRKPALFWLPFVWSYGGNLLSQSAPDGQSLLTTIDQPQNQVGLKAYRALQTDFALAPTRQQAGASSMSELFLKQRLAFLVSGRWSTPFLRQYASFEWDVWPFPVGPNGSKVGVDASGYAMSATSKYPDEAWTLLAFLSSAKASKAFTQSGLIVPARRDVAESLAFKNPAKAPAHDEVFLQAIEMGIPTKTPPDWNRQEEALNLHLDAFWDGKKR